jgi:hypothetical protein
MGWPARYPMFCVKTAIIVSNIHVDAGHVSYSSSLKGPPLLPISLSCFPIHGLVE